MEIHQLRYFVAVAQERSFSRAADKVRVSQPSLSQQIQKLEAELGQPLFDRLARRVNLTAVGHEFLPFAQRVLNELESARRAVEDRGKAPSGVVKLGVLPTIAPFIVRELVRRTREVLPGVTLNIVENVTDEQLRMVDAGELDLAVISTCRPDSGIHIERWAEESLLAAFREDHPLANRRSVMWRDLKNESVLLLHESHCLSRQIQKWCTQHRVQHKRVGALQLATLLQMVAAGCGISLVPEISVGQRPEGVLFVPFRGVAPHREINLLRNASHYQSKAAMAVAEIARALVREAIEGSRVV